MELWSRAPLVHVGDSVVRRVVQSDHGTVQPTCARPDTRSNAASRDWTAIGRSRSLTRSTPSFASRPPWWRHGHRPDRPRATAARNRESSRLRPPSPRRMRVHDGRRTRKRCHRDERGPKDIASERLDVKSRSACGCEASFNPTCPDRSGHRYGWRGRRVSRRLARSRTSVTPAARAANSPGGFRYGEVSTWMATRAITPMETARRRPSRHRSPGGR
jgi:hypothetical protein